MLCGEHECYINFDLALHALWYNTVFVRSQFTHSKSSHLKSRLHYSKIIQLHMLLVNKSLESVRCSFPAPPNITHMGFTYGHLSSNLTCISTGSPATAVTWMGDSQPLSLPDDTYTQIQTVTDRRLSTYETVLIIDAAATDITGHTYICTVINALGTASKELMACKFSLMILKVSPLSVWLIVTRVSKCKEIIYHLTHLDV